MSRIEAAATPATRRNRQAELAALLLGFREELAAVTVLDPACGSGNFLYVALELLLGLDREVIGFGTAAGLSGMTPLITPGQLRGLEINAYARELAQVVVWIGYLQWMIGKGFGWTEPVLAPLETIELRDALLDRSEPGHPREAAWPAADFIVGNPPFLGGKRIRSEIGDDYVEDLHRVFAGRLPPFADLVAYFFEKARAEIEAGNVKRVGLLATNSIRGGANRVVLDRIKASGDIFMAWDDEPWVLDGAAVRISIVGFDGGTEAIRTLDGKPVTSITSALTGGIDLSVAKRLPENQGICFLGVQLSGPFDMDGDMARRMLAMPMNPNGRPNSDVVKPLINGLDITRRPRDVWIADFGVATPQEAAALYEAPFEYVAEHVRPMREQSKSQLRDSRWWLTLWPRPEMREAIAQLRHYTATPTVAKHRIFVRVPSGVLPNHQVVVFAREDDYFFGVLQSRAHEVWSLRMGTWLGVGNDPRYTPTTCFETFPLPWPPGAEPAPSPPAPLPLGEGGRSASGRSTSATGAADAGQGRSVGDRAAAVGEAARALDEQRRRWLNPEGATEAELRTRTLTRLYNERPAWLANAHAALDRAVWEAYGWPDDPAETTDEQILERLLALNRERAGSTAGA